MSSPLICTSVARQRLSEAAALGRAVQLHYGEALIVLVVDEPPDGATTTTPTADAVVAWPRAVEGDGILAGTVRLAPAELELDASAVHRRALCCAGDDLAASLVPALARTLLRASGRPVIALSPATVLLGPLTELAAALASSPVVVIPRLLGPPPDDGAEPDGAAFTDAGAFDPTAIGVAPGGEAFLADGETALLDEAVRGVEIARVQRFLDRAPSSFGAAVLRHPGYLVTAWNAHERAVTWSPEAGYAALGGPLRCVGLQDFDIDVPELIDARATARPRVRLSGNPALARICAERVEALRRVAGRRAELEIGVRLADGTALDDRMRVVARRAIERRTIEDEPPDPFTLSGAPRFLAWLVSPDPASPVAPTLPRYLLELYEERRDLQWHFARVGTVDMAHFREWVEHHGLDEAEVAPALRDALAETAWWSAPTGVVSAPPSELRRGVTVAGYLRAESGVGEAARLAVEAMIAAKIEVSAVALGSTPSRQGQDFPAARGRPLADRRINVIWTNAEQLPGFASVVGPEYFVGRYNVGFWAWESERLPAHLAANAAMLDEIWVPSRFVRDAVTPVVDRPVHIFPHPIVAPIPEPSFDPRSLGIPQGFTFLFTYDFLSSFERKNPLGVLAAFVEAFPDGGGPVLVLKSVNGAKRPAELERLLLAAGGRRDVVVIDEYLTAGERAALIASCGCFVSLHRAEGFGLGLGEAMALGKPVIATAYSGNLDFMSNDTAVLVPAVRRAIGPGAAPYEPDDHWAEPDLVAASESMRMIAGDPVRARGIGARAREEVLRRHGLAGAERFVAGRIDEIEKRLRKGYVSGAHEAVARAR